MLKHSLEPRSLVFVSLLARNSISIPSSTRHERVNVVNRLCRNVNLVFMTCTNVSASVVSRNQYFIVAIVLVLVALLFNEIIFSSQVWDETFQRVTNEQEIYEGNDSNP